MSTAEDEEVGEEAAARVRFRRGALIGMTASVALFAALLLEWSVDLFATEPLSGFHDAQARSLLNGRWDAEADAFSFERFSIDGRFYTYFGPWPAVLRVPIVLVTSSLDGRLGRTSMLVAFVTALLATMRIVWLIRRRMLGSQQVRGSGTWATAGLFLALGASSGLLFLGSSAWVYNESALWGAAWATVSFGFILAHLDQHRSRDLVIASATATLALLSRPSVGAGPALALALVAIVRLIAGAKHVPGVVSLSTNPSTWRPRIGTWLGIQSGHFRGRSAVAAVVPFVAAGAVNLFKFGSLSVPWGSQDLLVNNVDRSAALEETGGTLTGMEYLVPNVVQYMRPDGLQFTSLFPWVTFPGRESILGDLPRDPFSPTASLLATTPLLALLSLVGLVVVVRGSHSAEVQSQWHSLRPLRAPVIGACGACLVTLLLASSSERYKVDAFPVLAIAAPVGAYALLTHVRGRPTAKRAIAAAALALGVWGVWVSTSLAVDVDRLYAPFGVPRVRAAYVNAKLDVTEALGGLADIRALQSSDPPTSSRVAEHSVGMFHIEGACDALRIFDGGSWLVVEAAGGPTPVCDRLLGP